MDIYNFPNKTPYTVPVIRRRLHPDAPRIVLRRLVKAAPMTQKAIAAAVGVREDSFSKILAGADGYDLETALLVNVLNLIGVDFAYYARQVERENEKLQTGDS